MDGTDKYQMFTLLGNEFTFDVDVSKLGCGLNGALYFVSMDADGGKSKYSGNKAGAKYGTGYCDAQCPRDLKFIDGKVSIHPGSMSRVPELTFQPKANSDQWDPSSNDDNAGVGEMGSCCSEMDIWGEQFIIIRDNYRSWANRTRQRPTASQPPTPPTPAPPSANTRAREMPAAALTHRPATPATATPTDATSTRTARASRTSTGQA